MITEETPPALRAQGKGAAGGGTRGPAPWPAVRSVAGRVLTQLGPWLHRGTAQGTFWEGGPGVRMAEGNPKGHGATELWEGNRAQWVGACRASRVGAPSPCGSHFSLY